MTDATSTLDSVLEPALTGVLLSTSRDPDAKLTFVSVDDTRLVVKVATSDAAADAVTRESRMLVDVRRLGLGALAGTVPRYVTSTTVGGRAALVATALPATPASIGYHRWRHTARPQRVLEDFAVAGAWLDAFQWATARQDAPLTWAADTGEQLGHRWDGHRSLDAALDRLAAADAVLSRWSAPRTAVHGDFWFGNLLVDGGAVSGVVDWEHASLVGCPLRDPVRFALSYALYLDRHTRPGRPVAGHRGLRREGFGAALRFALCADGWFPVLVRAAVGRHLERLGLPPEAWYAACTVGVAEVAATANDDTFAADHLGLLADLPLVARRPRRR